MRGVPGTKHISYREDLNIYEIIKRLNGKNEYFGRYHCLEDAIKWRDFFIENNWNTDLRLIGTPNKNIRFRLGKYRIYKCINGREQYFGSFDTFEEAEERVKQIRLKGWDNVIRDNERLVETTVTNIIQLRNGKYEIVKTIDKVRETFGVFDTYEEAEREVKLLRRCDWDYDALCESLDETSDGEHFVDVNKRGRMFYRRDGKGDFLWAKYEGII